MTRKVFSLLATLALVVSAQAETLNPTQMLISQDEPTANQELQLVTKEVAE